MSVWHCLGSNGIPHNLNLHQHNNRYVSRYSEIWTEGEEGLVYRVLLFLPLLTCWHPEKIQWSQIDEYDLLVCYLMNNS